MLRPLFVLAILTAMTILTPQPAAASGVHISGMSDLSAAKQKRADKHQASKRHASKRHASRRHANKRYDRMPQRMWRPGLFRSDPSFDPYGRPWRPNFYSNCYEDLGYGRFRSCDVF
jgi:hypothetical protein